MQEYYTEFGRRVRAARSGLTQLELSKRVGLSRAAVANVELGRQRVSLHMVALFAQALGVESTSLLPPDGLVGSPRERELQRLSPRDRETVEAVMRDMDGPQAKL